MIEYLRLLFASLVVFLCTAGLSDAVRAAGPDEVGQLTTALDDLDAWIGDEENGDKWRNYLRSTELRQAIDKGAEADPAVVGRVLQQYRSPAKGLGKRRFVTVRRELQSWLDALRNQYAGDLPKQVWAARGGHVPLTDESFQAVRDDLRQAAQRLQSRLGTSGSYVDGWKTYLRWSQLEPHFSDDMKVTGQSIRDLDGVLKRLRANKPGLEHPVFTNLADEVERYRELAFWYALGQRRDTRGRYDNFLKELEKQLTRNLERPTVESTRQIGKIVGLVEHLGHAPWIVEQVRSKFDRPNVWIGVSTRAINRLGQRPVSESQPVRDCILGARVLGTAYSQGMLCFRTHPATDHIAMDLQIAGNIQSRTASYKKPVRVLSDGSTNYVATKRVTLSDDRFLVMPADASAQTKTRTRSIQKTGGKFGRRLVQRIARKKVAQQKGQAEYISARHAEQKVAAKFDAQVVEAVYNGRQKYDEKLRPPLQRIGMFPEHLRMSSTSDSIQVETTLASAQQITTHRLPPGVVSGGDFNVQVHETALNNFLPHFLGGVKIGQEKQTEPPRLEGEVPGWMKKLTGDPKLKERFAKPAEGPTLAEADGESEVASGKFKPWQFTLNREHPVSVSFEDQQLQLRIRIAELKTLEDGEEKIRKNWDFLATYQVIQNGNGILLKREGKIEALPTGFDPVWFGDKRWGEKLTGKQVGVRKNLEENLNKRAETGQGIPKEIPIPAIDLPMAGAYQQTLELRQLDCDDGWLTLSYRLP